ncbi:MAG: winged helix-turn-helix domain-containing protein [Lachnospiraceae bacterium]|nr:winged helix-turn-helix domain-containing protein [Lachnospiraceae bacterium]
MCSGWSDGQSIEIEIQKLMRENPFISINQIAGSTDWTKGRIRYYIDKMKEAGILRHEGPQKGGKWILEE